MGRVIRVKNVKKVKNKKIFIVVSKKLTATIEKNTHHREHRGYYVPTPISKKDGAGSSKIVVNVFSV